MTKTALAIIGICTLLMACQSTAIALDRYQKEIKRDYNGTQYSILITLDVEPGDKSALLRVHYFVLNRTGLEPFTNDIACYVTGKGEFVGKETELGPSLVPGVSIAGGRISKGFIARGVLQLEDGTAIRLALPCKYLNSK